MTKIAPAAACTIVLLLAAVPEAGSPPCQRGMSWVDRKYCIDAYEATTLVVHDDGSTSPHSPYLTVDGLRVRAASQRNVVPQGYVSRDEADAACREAGKRLCTDDEWVHACQGPDNTRYPYGNARKPGYCVDTDRVAPLARLFAGAGIDFYRYGPMNDPRLNRIPGTLAPTGTFARCTNAFHVYDMVGNLHEWTADPAGTFRGGFYLDTKINGEGCLYRTVAHASSYHDYSTGFRCCKDPDPPFRAITAVE
jgi:formylglycine-generating enzyme required for sulfatase activity